MQHDKKSDTEQLSAHILVLTISLAAHKSDWKIHTCDICLKSLYENGIWGNKRLWILFEKETIIDSDTGLS